MKRFILFSVLLVLVFMVISVAVADDRVIVEPDAAKKFATLPKGVRFPEGITANPDTGDIYVSTFDFGPNDNKLLRFSKNGKLLAQIDFGPTPLLGLAFNPDDSKVYICNFGASRIQRVDADFADGAIVEDVAEIPNIAPPPTRTVMNPDGTHDEIIFGIDNGGVFPAPNALAFRYSDGALFVSDSFQGAVFLIENPADPANNCPSTTDCPAQLVLQDSLLATAGFPPFGANGLALNKDESELFIANTGDDRVLRLNLSTLELVVLTESINGADGLAFDREGILWVAANQGDEVVGLNRDGRVIAKLGNFLGVRRNGSVRGLLFPASLVIVKKHRTKRIFVTNLALPLTGTAAEPEVDVSKYTISQIEIPDLRRDRRDRRDHDDDDHD